MKNRFFFSLLMITIILVTTSSAQSQIIPCATTEYITYLNQQDLGIKNTIEETFFDAKRYSNLKFKKQKDTIYTIQVVFHVLYNNSTENLNKNYILSQLEELNECFRRKNADTTETRDIFIPVAADAGIEFELAKLDPEGNPTTGIIRKPTVLPTFGQFPINLSITDRVKETTYGSPVWDPDRYLNIWICDLSVSGFDALLGYAYPPTNAENWDANSFATKNKQGVVVHYKVVGKDNPLLLATGSKTLVHEVGHYLGLRHIWGDGSRFQGCNVDDFMDDTPNSRAASNGCNLGQNTCLNNPGDLPDMIENYMDYSEGECQNMFTEQQVGQMRSNLTLFRSGIATVRYPAPPVQVSEFTAIYPNPVVDNLTVTLADIDPEADYQIEITNLLGQAVFLSNLEPMPIQIIQGLDALQGMYLCKILKKGEEILTEKMLFQL
jgi:hypothetical protein